MTSNSTSPRSRWHRLAIAVLFALQACGSGGGDVGGTGGGGGSGGGGGGGSGGGGGNPGNGGGPGQPGGSGNPLAIVLDFSVANGSSLPRTETIRASVPFPEGAYQASSLSNLVVSGHQTAWTPLQFWGDGTLKVAQAQFTDEVAAGATKTYLVARDEPALTGPFQRNAWVAQFAPDLQFGAEVRDTFNVAYRSFATGSGELLNSTPLVETRRFRTYHTAVDVPGIGRDYLTSTFYVTEFHDMPFVMVDWLIGNDYLGADTIPPGNTNPNLRALGNADVRGAWFLCKGATAIERYFAQKAGIGSQTSMAGGFAGFRVMTDTYLGDAQTRRYRFLLRFEPSGASAADLQRWRDTATAMMQKPMYPLATQTAWEQTKAAGLLGGPIAGPSDSLPRATGEYQSWLGTDHFGTWGTHGDLLGTAVTGTPRNGPMSPEFAHAIQGQYHPLLQKLEQMAWIQALRPYHLWNLHIGAEQQILLWDGTPMLLVPGESLGRRLIADADPYPAYRTLSTGQPRAHGWFHFDNEHWTTDLLFDYYTVTGDAWAKEELRQLGESLKGLMRLTYYYTSEVQQARAEGWCMQGFVQVYQVTRDESLRSYAMRRVNEIVEVQRHHEHPAKPMSYVGNYPASTYPYNHEFFLPWQHGGVLYGYLAAYKYWQEPVLLHICEDVAQCVDYSWVVNATHPTFGFVPQGLRYYVPATYNSTPIPANYWDSLPIGIHFGDSPLGGAHTFLIGGLYHLADMTNDSATRTRALHYADILLGNLTANSRWNKWYFCLPTHYAE